MRTSSRLTSDDELQREYSMLSADFNAEQSVISSHLRSKVIKVQVLVDSIQRLNFLRQRATNLLLSYTALEVGGNKVSMVHVRKFNDILAKLRTLTVTTSTTLNALAEQVASSSGFKLPSWVSALVARIQCRGTKGYWTYAIAPESTKDNVTYALYYRIDVDSAVCDTLPYKWDRSVPSGNASRAPEPIDTLSQFSHHPVNPSVQSLDQQPPLTFTESISIWIKPSFHNKNVEWSICRSNSGVLCPPIGFVFVYLGEYYHISELDTVMSQLYLTVTRPAVTKRYRRR